MALGDSLGPIFLLKRWIFLKQNIWIKNIHSSSCFANGTNPSIGGHALLFPCCVIRVFQIDPVRFELSLTSAARLPHFKYNERNIYPTCCQRSNYVGKECFYLPMMPTSPSSYQAKARQLKKQRDCPPLLGHCQHQGQSKITLNKRQ